MHETSSRFQKSCSLKDGCLFHVFRMIFCRNQQQTFHMLVCSRIVTLHTSASRMGMPRIEASHLLRPHRDIRTPQSGGHTNHMRATILTHIHIQTHLHRLTHTYTHTHTHVHTACSMSGKCGRAECSGCQGIDTAGKVAGRQSR